MAVLFRCPIPQPIRNAGLSPIVRKKAAVRLVALFSLASGALLQTVTDTFFSNENNLFERLFKFLVPGDVLVADRNFCSYGNLSALLSKKVDSVMRMHQSRPADFRKGKALGKNHRLICWQKPTQKPRAMRREQFDLLPAQITLRMVRLHISQPWIQDP